jgi:AMMECR1 domain-containing protein
MPIESAFSNEQGQVLLQIARAAISSALSQVVAQPEPVGDAAVRLQAPGASFVTLTQLGLLRGCIGSLEARRPLLDDVKANAIAAALHDQRFAPLTLS